MMHNFLKKLAIMADQGKIPKTSVSNVDVEHDDWCAFLKDCRKECNCDPNVSIRKTISHIRTGKSWSRV